MHKRALRHARRHVIGYVALFVALSGTSYAAVTTTIPGRDGKIRACYKKSNGNVRVVSSSTKCRKSEKKLSWNQVGRQGVAGATGATGPKGDTGAKGETGADGQDFDSVLKSGQTASGVYAAGGGDAAATSLLQTAITFHPRPPAAIPHDNVHYGLPGAVAECPAHGEAAPGHLCVYRTTLFNATFSFEINPETNLASSGTGTRGIVLRFDVTGQDANLGGTWAYTAP